MGGEILLAVFVAFIIVLVLVAISCIKIVPQAQASVLERLELIRRHGTRVFILNCR